MYIWNENSTSACTFLRQYNKNSMKMEKKLNYYDKCQQLNASKMNVYYCFSIVHSPPHIRLYRIPKLRSENMYLLHSSLFSELLFSQNNYRQRIMGVGERQIKISWNLYVFRVPSWLLQQGYLFMYLWQTMTIFDKSVFKPFHFCITFRS